MDKQEKNKVFDSFIKKASKRLEEKKAQKRRELYIPSIDENIIIRSLTDAEITECFSLEDNLEADKYSAYLAIVEPNIKEVAVTLKNNGEIKEYVDVINLFTMSERTQIVKEIMDLSEVTGGREVEVVEKIKK